MSLEEKISAKISQTEPKPKWEFVGEGIAKDILAAVLIIVAIILFGIIGYIISHFGPWERLPGQPFYFWHSLLTLPWEMILSVGVLCALIYLIIRKAHFLYRLSPIIIVVGILVILGLGHLIAEAAGAHETIARFAPAKKIYLTQGRILSPNRGLVTSGTVKAIDGDDITVMDVYGKKWQVEINTTKSTIGKDLKVGDKVMINGIKSGNIIKAFIIKKIPANWRGQTRALFPKISRRITHLY